MNSKKLSTVTFEPDDGSGLLGRPTLRDLAKILEVVEDVTPNYDLLNVSRMRKWMSVQLTCSVF